MDQLNSVLMVLRKPRYAVFAVLASLGFGALHYFASLSLMQDHLTTVLDKMPLYLVVSLALSVAVAGLAGTNISLIIHKISEARLSNLKSGSSAIAGGTFGVFTPGCPACTTPLVAILGLIGGIAVLPLQGLELKILSVGVLAFSVHWISRQLHKSSCNTSNIELKKHSGGCSCEK